MSELGDRLDSYVLLRRGLGFTLKEADCLLRSFVAFADDRAEVHVTTELALAWASAHPGVLAVTKRQRLTAVRGFATYLKTLDERTEIPAPDLLPAHYRRITPHIFRDEEITDLIAAASTLTPPIRAATYQTLIGLLAVTGIRIGEAIRLGGADIDNARSLLTVRDSKNEKRREVPLHASTLAALAAYGADRDGHFVSASADSFFVSTLGTRLHPATIGHVWRHLLDIAGVRARGERSRPRVHDIRHSFTVKTIMGWYRDGIDVDASMPALSKMLGHASPATTYWYLTGVPELFALVSDRLSDVMGHRP